ncbi:hypothetical protein EDF50_0202 [Frigoribacterium sp. PhB24]|nr:hypothetical protein EDF50_0202 [Frigoribacterium sp. PhB24]
MSVPVPDRGPATASEERAELSRATGTLVFALQQSSGRTGPWPEQLFLLESSPVIVTTADGVRLVSLPVTAQLSYSTDATRSRFAVEMTGSTFGQTTRYDSVSGVDTTG